VWLRLIPLVIWLHVSFVAGWVSHANPFADKAPCRSHLEHDIEPWDGLNDGEEISGHTGDVAPVAPRTSRTDLHCPRLARGRGKRRARHGESRTASLRRWGACWLPAPVRMPLAAVRSE
jgi:hypothetical protein